MRMRTSFSPKREEMSRDKAFPIAEEGDVYFLE